MRLSGWKLPLDRLSATSLSTFAACPEQFRRKYILNEKEALSGDRFIGSVTHEALGKLFDPRETYTDDPGLSVAQAWQEIIEKDGEPEWHDKDATEAYKTTKKMIETYWPIANSAKEGVIASEQRFEEVVAGVPVSGYIDLEMHNRIREVKTSSRKESKPKSRHLFQGRLYSLVSDKPIEWHYVTRQVTPKVYTPNEEPGLYAEFNKDTTVAIIMQLVAYMNDCYARYGKENHWPLSGTFGDWTCGYCSFKKNCPAWS